MMLLAKRAVVDCGFTCKIAGKWQLYGGRSCEHQFEYKAINQPCYLDYKLEVICGD